MKHTVQRVSQKEHVKKSGLLYTWSLSFNYWSWGHYEFREHLFSAIVNFSLSNLGTGLTSLLQSRERLINGNKLFHQFISPENY